MQPLNTQERNDVETVKKPSPDIMKILMVVGVVAVAGFLVYKFMPKFLSEVKPSK